jgi:hypothetical protein
MISTMEYKATSLKENKTIPGDGKCIAHDLSNPGFSSIEDFGILQN